MGQTSSYILLGYVSLCLAACATADYQNEEEPFSETVGAAGQALTQPLLTAEIIQLQAGAYLSKVEGTCYLVRDETASQIAKKGDSLRHGDMIDLGDGCSVSITTSKKPNITLRREHGRFFRIEIPAE